MRTLLINPPDEMEAMFGVGRDLVQKYEPLGLLYVAAVAREAGHEVYVVDAYAEDLDAAALRERIRVVEPEVVGFSVLTCNGAVVYELGRWIKSEFPEVVVVLGNIHASVYARQYLESHACDVVVHGEGEWAFRDILAALERGDRDWSSIEAVSFLRDGREVRTGVWNVIDDLSALPLPARDLVDQRRYRLTELSNQNYITAPGKQAKTMVTSRGCVYRCRFCVVHHDRRPRYNRPDLVVDELEMLEKEMNTAYVYIQDPLFMGDKRRVIAICDEIRRRGLTIEWGCDANVNFMTPDLVRAMAGANCYELSLGIESGVQRLLDVVDKKITPDKVRRAVQVIRDNSDIQIEGLFILGLPGETEAEALETIRFARSLDIDMAQFSIMTPYPGSPLFQELALTGALDTGIRPDGTLDTSVWKHYSSYIMFTDMEPIWVTPTMDWRRLRKLQKKALRDFYLRPKQVLRQVRRLRPGNLLKTAKIALKGFF